MRGFRFLAPRLSLDTTFAWDAVGGASSYQLEIGTTPGGSEYSVTNVGNVLSVAVALPTGNYYARVRAIISGNLDTAAAEFYVQVP